MNIGSWEQKKYRLFLDASILIGTNCRDPLLERLKILVDANKLKFVTTEHTILETANKKANNEYELIKDLARPHIRQTIEEIFGVQIPPQKKEELKTALFSKHIEQTKKFLNDLKVENLALDVVKPSLILSSYANREGFFEQGKKDQFPDAFIFACIALNATDKSPIIIISDDRDFDKPLVHGAENIAYAKSLIEALKDLGLSENIANIESFIMKEKVSLVEQLNDELNDWGLVVVDIDDAEIEYVDVIDVELKYLTCFGSLRKGEPMLVVGKFIVKANVSYTHPDWDTAIWDSEDKVAMPLETVDGMGEIELEFNASLTISVDTNGDPEEIVALDLHDYNFQYINLSQVTTL